MAEYAGIIGPRATIEAVVAPDEVEKIARAFSSGQPVMLERCGGPWIVTRMETSQDFDQAAPVTRLWATLTDPSGYDWIAP